MAKRENRTPESLALNPNGKRLLGLGKPDAARCEEHEANFKTHAAVLERELVGHRFLVNDQLTIADFCVASSLTYAEEARLPLT